MTKPFRAKHYPDSRAAHEIVSPTVMEEVTKLSRRVELMDHRVKKNTMSIKLIQLRSIANGNTKARL